MVNIIGGVNWVGFISAYLISKFDLIQAIQSWNNIMFSISATAAAVYGILKVISIIRDNKKNKDNG